MASLAVLQAELVPMRTLNADLKRKNAGLTEKNAELTEKNAGLTEENAVMGNAKAQLAEANSALNQGAVVNELRALRSENDDLRASFSANKAALAAAAAKSADLAAENAGHQRKYAGVRKRETEVECDEDRIGEIISMRDSAVAQLKAVSAENRDLREFLVVAAPQLEANDALRELARALQLEVSKGKGALRGETERRRAEVAAAKAGVTGAKQDMMNAMENVLEADVAQATCPMIDPRWTDKDGDEEQQSPLDECTINFYIMVIKLSSTLSPSDVNKSIVVVTEWLLAESSGWLRLVPNWKERLLSPTELRNTRTDQNGVGRIDAGLHIGRASELVTAWSDGTSKEGEELLNVIVSVRPTVGSAVCKHVCVNGVDILRSKTAKTAAKAKAAAFVQSRALVQQLVDRCVLERGRRTRRLRGMTQSDWRSLDDSQFDEKADLCDPRRITGARIRLGGSDHCPTAQAALRKFAKIVKTEQSMVDWMGAKWAALPAAQKAEWLDMDFIGCQMHLRCIWFNGGYLAVEKELQQLESMKAALAEIKQLGVRCVDGDTSSGQRGILSYFGNTTKSHHLSIGRLFKQTVAEQSGKGCVYEHHPHKNVGNTDLGQRFDAKAEQAFENAARIQKIGEFFDQERYGAETENNFDKSVQLYIESDCLQTASDLYALVFATVLAVHRTAVGKGGMEAVQMPDGLVKQGLPQALECLDPVQSYEMFEEVQQWAMRVEQNPVLALSRDTWKGCYTTPLFRNWGAYHEWLHSKGHGRNAAGAQTEDTYWQLCRDTLLDGLEGYKSQDFRDGEGGEPYNLMLKLITVFCGAARKAAERDNNDYGWFAIIRAARQGDHGAKRKLVRLRKHGRGSLSVSPNEGFFGVYDGRMRQAMQMRIDALGGQSMVRWNDTFGERSSLAKLRPAVQKFVWLCMRKVVKQGRKQATTDIAVQKERATKRARKVKKARVVAGINKQKIELSRCAIAFNIEIETRAGMVKLLADPAISQDEKTKAMKQVVLALVEGQGFKQGACQASCSNGKPRQPCHLECTAQIPRKALDSYAAGGHMREHVLELLRKWEANEIPRKGAPSIPLEIAARGFGSITLGQASKLAKERQLVRQQMTEKWLADALANPEKYSPFIMIDKCAQMRDEKLLQKKIEVRWLMEATEEGQTTTFLHCFEGTVIEVRQYGKGRQKELGLDFGKRVPIALVRMDPIFKWPDVYIPLDLELYAKEDKHYGWNVLTDEYVRAFERVVSVLSDDESGVSDSDDSDDDSDAQSGGG